MTDFRRARCMIERGGCGRHRSEVGLISWGGLCGECGPRKFEQATDELRDHNGPWFDHWRRQSALAVGAVLVDDLAALLPDDG